MLALDSGHTIGDIGHPSLIWLLGLELPVQVIGSHMGRLAAIIALVALVATLGADALDLHEAMHSVLTTSLPKIFQVQGDVPVTVNTATLQPGLLD